MAIKDKRTIPLSVRSISDLELAKNLQATVMVQGNQIQDLRKELRESKAKIDREKEINKQMDGQCEAYLEVIDKLIQRLKP